jgi:hypothetical protein
LPMPPQQPLSFRIPHQNSSPNTWYMHYTHFILLNLSQNIIWCKAKIKNLLLHNFLASWYFHPLRLIIILSTPASNTPCLYKNRQN